MAPPIPVMVKINDSPVYRVGRKLGEGGFGKVYAGRRDDATDENIKTGPDAAEFALKFERRSSTTVRNGVSDEWNVYEVLEGCYGIPRVYFKGTQSEYCITVMDMLGPSLWDLWKSQSGLMDKHMVICIAIEGIYILKEFHSRGYVHGDIKPDNFCLGQTNTPQANKLFLVDFGLAARWLDIRTNSHVVYDQQPFRYRGTMRYASVHVQLGRTPSRRDDLESFVYMLILLLQGRLPWQDHNAPDPVEHKGFNECKIKREISLDTLCRTCPKPFKQFAQNVFSLKFDEEPEYTKYISLLNVLISSSPDIVRPINIETAQTLGASTTVPRVGDKRGAIEMDDNEDEQRTKKVRSGVPEAQWIILFDDRPPMEQRYFYDVETVNVDQHIEQGKTDGLFISNVASCLNLWTFILDKQTGFTDQVYLISSTFLDMHWIMKQWDDNYYITALAGADDGGSFVVMSKGTPYLEQEYRLMEYFPYTWIQRQWDAGFSITSMATQKNTWAIIMSKGAEFSDQVVELDFLYPSEGVHKRWEAYYSITSIAATNDQTAIIFSAPKQKPSNTNTQGIFRSLTFPYQRIEECRDNNRYVISLCYGRSNV
ncbi:hypothetical protein ABFX02_13G058100 [Erythranthe guttata]